MRWPWLVLLACACACATRHITLPRGSADVLTRWSVLHALPLGDGRIVIAGGDHKQHGPLVACVDEDGDVDWRVSALAATDPSPVRIAVTGDGATWILSRTRGSFDASDRPMIAEARTALTRVDRNGRIEREVRIADEGVPFFVTAVPDGGAIAVIGTQAGLVVTRVAADGTVRYAKALDRGVSRAPSDIGIQVVGTLHGDTLWIAGAGTTLYVAMPDKPDLESNAIAPDGTFHGPTVLALAADTGEPRRLYPLVKRLDPGGWDYPSGLVHANGKLVLARNGSGGRITVHDPETLRIERTLYTVTTAELHTLALDGTHVLVGLRQTGHDTAMYGDRAVTSRTAPPTTTAALAIRVPLDGASPSVLAVANSRPVGRDDVGGDVGRPIPVALRDDLAVVGTFHGDVVIDGKGPLTGVYGSRRECLEGRCGRRDWGATSTYVVRVRRPKG